MQTINCDSCVKTCGEIVNFSVDRRRWRPGGTTLVSTREDVGGLERKDKLNAQLDVKDRVRGDERPVSLVFHSIPLAMCNHSSGCGALVHESVLPA